jgi:hypothetical protein
MEDVDFRIPVSTFESKDDTRPARHEMDWRAFAQRLCKYDERPTKDGRAWSPVTYRAGTTRGKANVDLVHALVLDVDHGPLPIDLLERWEYVAHTTFQHTPEAPRWRVVMPLSRPLAGVDWPDFWLRANAFFGGCVDPATKDSSRIFYLPSCPPGAEHKTEQRHGTLLDPDELPEVPKYEPPAAVRTGGSKLMTRHLADWATRFCLAGTGRLAAMPPDSGRNAACNRLAYTLAGLAADPLHDLRQTWVEDQLFDACVSNGLVAEDGERGVRATIDSGYVAGLLHPWSPADQDPLLPARPYQRPTERPPLYAVEDLRLDVVRMSDVVAEPINWLWRGRLARGKLTLLMGDPGLGKSLITHWLASKISTGGEWPDGGECERAAAIVFTIEDALADTVKPRLIAADADMNRVWAVRGVVNPKASLDARMFTLEEHIGMLEQLITDEGASLVVMDPVSAYLGPNVNAHKETDVRRVLGLLSMMAERTGVAVLMVIHLNKGKDVAALNRATGSVAFPAVSRIVLGVAPDPTDEDNARRLFLSLKCNVARKPGGLGYRIESAPSSALLLRVADEDRPPVLVWDDEPVLDDMALALDRGSTEARTMTEEAVAAIKHIFQSYGHPESIPSAVMHRELKEADVSTSGSVLHAARAQLGVRCMHVPPGVGNPYHWFAPKYLPTESREAQDSREQREDSLSQSQTAPDAHKSSESRDSPNFPFFHTSSRAREDITPELCPVHKKLFSLHDCDQL